MTELNQAESHQSRNMETVLEEIISIHKNGEMFSDPLLLRTLDIAPKSLQRIRKQLFGLKIIEKDDKRYTNNEKFYMITDLKKAEKKLKETSEMTSRKLNEELYGKYFANYKVYIPSEINIKFDKKIPNKNLPKVITRKEFLRDYCPVCKRKTLRSYIKGQRNSLIDKQCKRCHINFFYRFYPALIQAEKY